MRCFVSLWLAVWNMWMGGFCKCIVDKHGLTYQGCKSSFQVLFKMFLTRRSEGVQICFSVFYFLLFCVCSQWFRSRVWWMTIKDWEDQQFRQLRIWNKNIILRPRAAILQHLKVSILWHSMIISTVSLMLFFPMIWIYIYNFVISLIICSFIHWFICKCLLNVLLHLTCFLILLFSGLLGALQALSAAVMGSSEEDDDEEGQAFTVTQTPSCADTHKE